MTYGRPHDYAFDSAARTIDMEEKELLLLVLAAVAALMFVTGIILVLNTIA